MKESQFVAREAEKVKLVEWADERGLKVADHELASKHRKECIETAIWQAVFMVGALLLAILYAYRG